MNYKEKAKQQMSQKCRKSFLRNMIKRQLCWSGAKIQRELNRDCDWELLSSNDRGCMFQLSTAAVAKNC